MTFREVTFFWSIAFYYSIIFKLARSRWLAMKVETYLSPFFVRNPFKAFCGDEYIHILSFPSLKTKLQRKNVFWQTRWCNKYFEHNTSLRFNIFREIDSFHKQASAEINSFLVLQQHNINVVPNCDKCRVWEHL